MKKYCYTIITILFFGLLSCSNEETKTQNQIAARPTVPIQNNEVRIGNQVWMTKNLNVSRYRNGDLIPQVTNPTQWANLTTGAWCYFENNTANGTVYGKLYNWYAVNDTRKLAPIGYHIPTDAEWTTLTTFLGGEDIAGGKMKSTTGWIAPNTGATNISGFTGFPGGDRTSGGVFYDEIGYAGIWWSSTEDGEPYALVRDLGFDDVTVGNSYADKGDGYSVRCIKN